MRQWLFPFLLAVAGLVVLLAPIPFIFQKEVQCLPCDPGLPRSKCPKCPQKGDLGWGPSFSRLIIWEFYKYQSREIAPPLPADPVNSIENFRTYCKQSGGRWLENYQECEGIQRLQCDQLGGTYADCESPCRNDPKSQQCITLCVQVCKL